MEPSLLQGVKLKILMNSKAKLYISSTTNNTENWAEKKKWADFGRYLILNLQLMHFPWKNLKSQCLEYLGFITFFKGRIGEALKFIEPERLILAPDCGLGFLEESKILEKLETMTKVAKEFWSEKPGPNKYIHINCIPWIWEK